MTRGFITIATGKKHYYELAAHLLLSYRFFTNNPYPFAIIAEEHNEYTALFDDVIITAESMHSFTDKFLLLKLCPYDETIFFDADSLAYGDLNQYWDFFKDATDFSATGENFDLHAEKGAWYNAEDIGVYGSKIEYKSRVHAGVCFVRKSEKTLRMYEDCMDIYRHYNELYFHTAPASVDECVFGVAMPMNNMKAIPECNTMLAAYPCLTSLKADLLNDVLTYSTPWAGKTEKGILLHWGTLQTHNPLYKYNVECLKYRIDKSGQSSIINKLKYEYRLRFFDLYVKHFLKKLIIYPFSFVKRAVNHIKRKANKARTTTVAVKK